MEEKTIARIKKLQALAEQRRINRGRHKNVIHGTGNRKKATARNDRK